MKKLKMVIILITSLQLSTVPVSASSAFSSTRVEYINNNPYDTPIEGEWEKYRELKVPITVLFKEPEDWPEGTPYEISVRATMYIKKWSDTEKELVDGVLKPLPFDISEQYYGLTNKSYMRNVADYAKQIIGVFFQEDTQRLLSAVNALSYYEEAHIKQTLSDLHMVLTTLEPYVRFEYLELRASDGTVISPDWSYLEDKDYFRGNHNELTRESVFNSSLEETTELPNFNATVFSRSKPSNDSEPSSDESSFRKGD